MQIVFYAAIALGLYLVARSISLASLQLRLMSFRDAECVARIAEQQKACDRIITSYYLVSVFVALWIATLGLYIAVSEETPKWLSMCVPAGLVLLYLCYFVYRACQMRKFDLVRFHADMNAYRSTQKKVTPDNNDEVNFLRAFKQVKKQTLRMFLWAVLTLALATRFMVVM